MAKIEPMTMLSAFSRPNPTPTDWSAGRDQLASAELCWIWTVRLNGRPHVTPLLGVWLDWVIYFCTETDERKSKNLAEYPGAHSRPVIAPSMASMSPRRETPRPSLTLH